MDYPQEFEVTKEERMWRYLFLCCPILREAQEGGACLKSVHNQRIERLWRDLYYQVIFIFYNLFHHMETCHVLNPDNDVHIFCLHYVFTPRINRDLDSFVAAWNRHGISSAGNQTPLQLWMMGMNSVAYSDLLVAQEIFDEVLASVKCLLPLSNCKMVDPA